MYRSRLPEDTSSDYTFIQQFFTSMHPGLWQDVEVQNTREEDINTVIAMAERIDSIYRSRRSYGKAQNDKQQTNTTKKQNPKPKKQFDIKVRNSSPKE